MKCPKCFKEVKDGWKLCPWCRTSLVKQKLVCSNCGEELEEGFTACPFCGEDIKTSPASILPDSILPDSLIPETSQAPQISELSNDLDLVSDDILELEQQEKKKQHAEYVATLKKAKMLCMQGDFVEADKIYEAMIDKNPMDVNAYIGLIRVTTKNYTLFEDEKIDNDIKIAEVFANGAKISELDADFADYVNNRKAYSEKKEQAKLNAIKEAELKKRKQEEAKRAAEKERLDAIEAERKRLAFEAEKKRIEQEAIKAIEAERIRKIEEAKQAEERKNKELLERNNADCISDYGYLKSYVGKDSCVTIPKRIGTIGKNAFENNLFIEKIILSENIDDIREKAFKGCKNLKEINLQVTDIKSVQQDCFMECGLTSVSIPYWVRKIESRAFFGCERLRSVEFEENVTIIEGLAFADCIELESLFIPKSVQTINSTAFLECTMLNNVKFEDPNGWYAKGILIPRKELENPRKAAEYLLKTVILEKK